MPRVVRSPVRQGRSRRNTPEQVHSDHVARTWFLRSNPVLAETSPVLALREGRIKDVAEAAQTFVDGSWSA